ncbi:MAG: carbonic anhydrase [Geminicoccaceae bacterium]
MRIALVLATLVATASSADAQSWSYEDDTGPDVWSTLSDAYSACGTGQQQSPVDLTSPVEAEVPEAAIDWKADEWRIVNNGHTIELEADDAGGIVIGARSYALQQFHFHHPSEHAIDGDRFLMEAHFVHADETGALAVVAAMISPGAKNETFTRIMENAPVSPDEADIGTLDPAALLPSESRFFRYRGSLTTPPCSETVVWTVLAEPIKVTAADIQTFKKIFPMNARPLHPLNRRFVLAGQ